jgi:HEAT repeat protein
LSESAINYRLYDFLGHENSEIRREVRSKLVDKGNTVVEDLIPYLDNNDHNIVNDALWILEKIKDPRTIEPLANLFGDESISIRKKAAKALVQIGDPALPIILKQLEETDFKRRRIASSILPEFEDPSLAEILFNSIEDNDPIVRRNSARAIGILNVCNAVKPLRKALKDEDWRVRQWAAASLGLISSKTGATQSLIKALNDESEHVKYAAIIALGDNKSKSAVDRLLKILKNEDSIIRCAAIKALGNIGSQKAVKPLINQYFEGDIYIQSEVLLAVGRIGGSSLIYEVMEDALSKKDLENVASIALNLIGTKKHE